jgi:WD40 repeat protein/DNA-binding Xre family transcriptional regulator
VRRECIEIAKLAVGRSSFLNQQALAEDAGLARATVSNFLRGKPVDRATFVELCQRLSLNPEDIADFSMVEALVPQREVKEAITLPTASLLSPLGSQFQTPVIDWGEALDVSLFYGRAAELAKLEQWLCHDRCRLVMLLGMGGIGKTALSVRLAEQLQDEFEFVIWRSLRNAPSVQELLTDLLSVLSRQRQLDLPDSFSGKLYQLLDSLRTHRCLLVLDNLESILVADGRAGAYRDGYAVYGQLLETIGQSRHQSCLVFTSREQPRGLSIKVGSTLPIRALHLAGLEPNEGQQLITEKGFALSAKDGQSLIERYSGNPLALKIVATTIQSLFQGNVADFLAQSTFIFGDLSDLLAQQFERLTDLEQQVMVWLAINREGTSLADLREDLVPAVTQRALLEAVESLQNRSLIETVAGSQQSSSHFTQQPVVMEYVTERLIEQISEALMRGEIGWCDRYALSKAQTKDYLRNMQCRLILQPMVDRLLAALGSKEAVQQTLDIVLANLKTQPLHPPDYAPGNLINLLSHLNVSLRGYDFSNLVIRQVYFQGVNLQGVNFSHADLTQTVFTQTLGDILTANFSPNGTLLATAIDRDIILWQVTSRKQLVTLTGHTAWILSVAFSPDGKLIASGSNDQTVRLWDWESGQCLKTLKGHTSGVQAVAFSPDGHILASGSHDHTIQLWNVQTQQCLRVLQGHCDRVLGLIFCPDQRTLISSSEDKTIRLWDLRSGECLQMLQTQINWVCSMALSPDGRTLVTGSDSQFVRFWDLQTGECMGFLPDYNVHVWAIAFSPNGQWLATASADKTVRLWDLQTKQCLKTFQEHKNQVWQVNFSPDGRTLVSSGDDQTVRLWNVRSGQCLTTLESHSNWISSVAFSPQGKTLASASKDHLVRLWCLHSGECRKILHGHADAVMAVAFSPDGEILASASDDRTIKLWDASTGECLKNLRGHTDWVHAIQFSPNHTTLISGSCDHTVKLWDVRSGECLYSFEGHTHRVKSVAFSPDSTKLASGSGDHTVQLWQVSGERLQTFNGHTDWVFSVAYSPKGHLLASGSGDHTIKLWDELSGKCLQTLQGHTHRVRSVAFSPDGTTLASGSEDRLVKLWDVQTGRCLKTLHGHRRIVWAVTFHHQEPILTSCSEDGTIRMWDSDTGECLKILQVDRPYEGMNLTGAIGLTTAQRATLRALGAIESELVMD